MIMDRITKDLMFAMKNKQTDRLEALRAVKTAFILARTNAGNKDVTEDEELKIIQKLVKQRKDSAAEFLAQNRSDLAEKETAEAAIISEYLPKQLSVDEIKTVVTRIVSETAASSMKDMGKVMGIASKELAGKADGKTISDIVKELLG